MSITFGGLATGIDTDSIVTQLMSLERAPITRLEAKKTDATSHLEAYAQFKTTLDDLKSAVSAMNITSQVRSTSASISSGAPFTATSASASSGSYNIAVEQLAQVQKDVSVGVASQNDALLGTGTFTLTKGTEDFVISVDATNNSLSGLATAINAQSTATGIKATIINDGTAGATAYRMVLTGTDSSSAFTATSTLTTGTDPATAFSTTSVQSSQQAIAYVDGIKIVSNSNTISGAISGVTLNLNGVSEADATATPPYKASLLEIKPDTGALKEKLTTFVTSYNKVMDWILSGYDEFKGSAPTTTTDPESEKLLGSVLRGDSSINSVKRGLQSVLSSVTKTSGSLSILSQLGITTNLDGTLTQNNTKMDAALRDNFDGAVSLLAGDDTTEGVMKKFNSYLLDVTSTSKGLYATKKKSYDQTVKRIDVQVLNLEPRMAKREASLRAQYTAMEQLVSGLNAQASFLTQQMDMLSNMMKGD